MMRRELVPAVTGLHRERAFEYCPVSGLSGLQQDSVPLAGSVKSLMITVRHKSYPSKCIQLNRSVCTAAVRATICSSASTDLRNMQAAVRLLTGCSAEGLAQFEGLLGMCSVSASSPPASTLRPSVLQSGDVTIDFEKAKVYRDYVTRVAPDLLDGGKASNLTAAVFKKFCPCQIFHGAPKPKTNADGTVYKFHVPEISWMRHKPSNLSNPTSKRASPSRNSLGEVEPPSSSNIWHLPHRTVESTWKGPLRLVDSRAEAESAVKRILDLAEDQRSRGSDPRERVLGFDVESKPRWNASLPESPPTVIQVATATEVYVFHVKHFTPGVMVGASAEIIARSLQPLLPLFTSKHVFKVGVGVQGDVTLLKRFSSNLQCHGFHDMTPVALGAGFKRNSLRALSTLLLGHSISKKQQMSNWDRPRLSDAQVDYAATDAWVSREIAIKLAPLWLPQADTGT